VLRRTTPHLERRTTWLELAFDLVFVVAVTQLADGFATAPGVEDLDRLALLFLTVYLTWSETTRAINLLEGEDAIRYAVILVQVLAFSAAAAFIGDAWDHRTAEFAYAVAVGRAAVVIEFVRAARHVSGATRVLRAEAAAASAGVALGVIAGAADIEWLLPVAALTALVGPLLRLAPGMDDLLPSHPGHIAERFGLFTVIVLGDAHAEVIDALTEGGATLAGLAEAGAILLVAAGLWWAYFRGIDDSSLRLGGGAGIGWLGIQLLLTGAVAAFGGIARRLADHDATPAQDLAVLWACIGLALVALAAVQHWRTPAQPWRALRLGVAGVAAAVAAVGPEWSAAWALPVMVAHTWVAVR
jgi:low temperature requirement protein LtrA